MEETDEFKWAVKVVIKRQMRDLVSQLQESGEEVAIMSVNMDEESCSLFGSPTGEWFLSEQKNITKTFLSFCKTKSKRVDGSQDTPVAPRETTVPQTLATASVQKTDGTTRPRRATPGRRPKHLIEEQEPAVMRVLIPTDMAPAVSEEELASLVGRVFAAKVVAGKMQDHATKFDDLVESINLRELKSKRAGAFATPSSKRPRLSASDSSSKSTTRSGRKVSSKFLEGLMSLKKKGPPTIEKEEPQDTEKVTQEEETVETVDEREEEFSLLLDLLDLDPVALKRFTVCTSEGDVIDVKKTVFTNYPELETVAVPLILAVNKTFHRSFLLDLRSVQLFVGKDETLSKIKVEIADIQDTVIKIKSEKSTESENENEVDSTIDEMLDDDSDFDESEGPGVIVTSSTPREARSAGMGARDTLSPSIAAGLIRRPKKRSASELMLMKCEECGISVTGKSNLKSHIRRIHMNVRNFTCTICGKAFWSNNARESHMLAVHTRKCESCQEYVVESVPWGKGVDMKTKRDVICTCGSIVSIYSTFGRRRMYLRDDEPDEEGNVRTSRSKSNSGTKYACGTCGKLFMKKSNCERHSRAHTDMKVCACDICGSTYAYESSLKKHMHSEHGIVKHVCELCGGNYGNMTALKVHMVKAHHNVAIGDNVAIVLQTKGDDEDEDLEQISESLQAKELETAGREAVAVEVKEITGPGDGAQEDSRAHKSGQVFIQTPSGQQLLVSTADPGLLQHGVEVDAGLVRTAEVQVEEEELRLEGDDGEGGQQVVISTEGGTVSEAHTQQIVQEVLRSGQLVAQEGGMSIIIKQVPMDSPDLQ